MAVENEEQEMTADDHTAAALHSALDACLAEDSDGKAKAKKLAKIMKAMHGDEEEGAEGAEGEGKTKDGEKEPEKKTEPEEKKPEDKKPEEDESKMEQKPIERGELFEQAAAIHPRIDREKGIIHRVHVLGNNSKWGYSYATEAQKAVYTRYEGMPVGIDHDYQSKPMTVAGAFGTLRNPSVDGEGTWADLHYLKTHEQAPTILEDIERGTGIFALSSVNGKAIEKKGVITSFVPGRVDVVVGGGTTRTILEQAPPAIPPASKEEYDALKTLFEQQQAKLTELEKRLILREQYVAPQSTLAQTIAKVEAAAAVPMSKFWNDPK